MIRLPFILESVITFFAGSDFNNVFDIIDEYFTVAHVGGVQRFFYRVDYGFNGYLAYDNINLTFGSSLVFTGAPR